MSAKKDYDETKESEQAIKLIERQCSSTLGIMRQLELTSENGLSIAPAPSSVGSSLRWPAGGERLRYDLDPPSSTRLPNGLGLLEETDVGVDPNADKRSERSFTTA